MLEGRTSTPYLTRFCFAPCCTRAVSAMQRRRHAVAPGRMAQTTSWQRMPAAADLDDYAHVCQDEQDDDDVDEAAVVVVRVLGRQHRRPRRERDVRCLLRGRSLCGHGRCAFPAVPAVRAWISTSAARRQRANRVARPAARAAPQLPAVRALVPAVPRQLGRGALAGRRRYGHRRSRPAGPPSHTPSRTAVTLDQSDQAKCRTYKP
jgi:hypothetical protein